MLTEDNKGRLISNGLMFLRSITEEYGTEEGMKLWETICTAVDPELKGQIFFAMLTGEYYNEIRITSADKYADKITLIKALRAAAEYGLKEAKDVTEDIQGGREHRFKVKPDQRNQVVRDLRHAGFRV
jgi:ribosomal protein L7/L12